MATTAQQVCQMAMAIEISSKKWICASVSGFAGSIRRKSLGEESVHARFEALVVEIGKARLVLNVDARAPIMVAYEAGQEGFWLVRALRERGLRAEVIDPSSLPVVRGKRRVKTDRVDAESLVRAMWRWSQGELQALRMVRVPSVVDEDNREWQRERDRLESSRRAGLDRITKKLRSHGVWILPRKWRVELKENRLRDFFGKALGTMLQSSLMIELSRVEMLEGELKTLAKKHAELDPRMLKRAHQLEQLKGIGDVGGTALASLLFWRSFENRRQVGACIGLVGTPHDSGTMQQDLGISKKGDPRLRALLIDLAWFWLRHQPGSELTQWFKKRTEGGGKRHRKVMIVGLARKLAIALWRYLEHGVLPAGASLKTKVA